MDEQTQLALKETGPILCLDIGALTQNVILARPGHNCENWPRWTLPSMPQLIGQRIRELTLLKRNVWLYGCEIGGGFANALREHLASGLKAFATEQAAKSIHDDMEAVQKLGVEIAATCPCHAVPVRLNDFDMNVWTHICRSACLPQPHMILASAQDHGKGNRKGRNEWWRESLAKNPDPVDMIHETAPQDFSRLSSLQSQTGGPVADSGVSAILGALCDPRLFERSFREGITFIHAGNAHTVAALLYRAKIYGIYEHHTNKMDLSLLLEDLKQFRLHWLPAEAVQKSGGVCAAYRDDLAEAGSFEPTFISGPQRKALQNYGAYIAPHGDMPHGGCLGLLYGWSRKMKKS